MNALNDILSSFGDKYYIGNELNKAKVIQDIDRYDEELIVALLSNELVKKHYARKIGEYTLIETNKLIETFEMDNYWMDSYTKYSKKIGLTSNRRFLDESTDVVLDFPYKDTVLKAGMSKEDVEKEDLVPNEPFYNEMIAAEEIDTLLDKKVLVNAKRYTTEGVEYATEFSEEDNLILKGNNLLGLHTLKEKYAGKVKLIYIDPPYNTGNDSFQYNDNFNHSTWLTFMKNRLEIASELLNKEGYIVIQTDDAEQAYLKILMDNIFGKNNYLNTVSVLFKNVAGASGGGEDRRLKKNIEYLTIFSKTTPGDTFNDVHSYIEIGSLVERMRNDGVSWKYTSVLVDPGEKLYIGSTVDGSGDEIKIYKRNNYIIKSIGQLQKEENISEREAYLRYGDRAFQTAMPQSSIRPRVMEKFKELILESNELVSIEYVPKSGRRKGQLYEQFYKGDNFRLFAWLKDVTENIDGILYKAEKLGTFWDFVGETKNVNKEGKVVFSNGKKPEGLIQKIIELTTEENDIVLDFFLGSGSTAATAHKLNRKYIGIEQMNYVDELVISRLESVILGDTTGISKDVNWQGGGSFVYAELMEKSKGYLESVLEAENTDSLKQIYQLMLDNVDLDFRADLEGIQEMLNDAISLEDKKRLLVKVIDKNQLYYNYSEIDDANVLDLISDTDYTFNQSFYKEEEIDGQEDQ